MNDDLNRALAEATGWTFEAHQDKRPNKCGALDDGPHWHNESGVRKGLSDWAASLDALRDGPERVLRKRGLRFFLATDLDGVLMAEWIDESNTTIGRFWASDEAEARARAALAALTDQRQLTTGLTSSAREPLVRDVLPLPHAPRTDGGE